MAFLFLFAKSESVAVKNGFVFRGPVAERA